MTRQQKHPLRELDPEERHYLEKVSRSQSESASRVVRAKLVLAVAKGCNYTDAAHSVGRRSGDAVGKLVARFNEEGIAALNLRHGGAYCVASSSYEHAAQIYAEGKLLSSEKGAWLHIIKN